MEAVTWLDGEHGGIGAHGAHRERQRHSLQVNGRDKHGERTKAWFMDRFKPKLLE